MKDLTKTASTQTNGTSLSWALYHCFTWIQKKTYPLDHQIRPSTLEQTLKAIWKKSFWAKKVFQSINGVSTKLDQTTAIEMLPPYFSATQSLTPGLDKRDFCFQLARNGYFLLWFHKTSKHIFWSPTCLNPVRATSRWHRWHRFIDWDSKWNANHRTSLFYQNRI